MFGYIKKLFIELLAGVVNVSNQTKFISLSNKPCKIKATVIDLSPYEYNQGLCYYINLWLV